MRSACEECEHCIWWRGDGINEPSSWAGLDSCNAGHDDKIGQVEDAEDCEDYEYDSRDYA